MAEQNTHINYSVQDIERYLSGRMSAKEMHEIEKAALQDAFLADAIEGFRNTSFEESRKHLNEITAALQKGEEETKVVALPSKSFYWWKAAAIIIFIAGIGAVSLYIIGLNNSVNKNEVAQLKENKANAPDTIANKQFKGETAKSDSAKTLLAENKASHSLQKEKKKNNHFQKHEEVVTDALTQAQPSTQKISETIVADSLLQQKKDSSQIAALSAPLRFDTQKLEGKAAGVVAQDKRYLFSNNNALNNFSGHVTDNNNQPVAFATVQANDKAVTTDTNGYFKLQAPDSLVNVIVSSVGFVSANTQLKSDTTNHILIQPDKRTLSEVAITGYATKKQARKNLADSAYPSGGWESFKEYVYKKLGKPPDTLNDEEITEGVQIEFSIDENGLPYNFTVLKSLNDDAASKAIKIIKEGPRWITTSKTKKGRVSIQF